MSSNATVLRLCVRRIIPLGLLLGAGMETFMYYTGFWNTATKNAVQRDAENKEVHRLSRQAAIERKKKLFDVDSETSSDSKDGKTAEMS